MAYGISTAFAIYFVLWWLVLFLTLPFGVRSQHEDGEGAGQMAPGTDPGAPVLARMGSKLIWTTIISAVIFAISMWAYYQGYFNIERLAKLMGMPF
jgi:predicted secreted protein